MSVGAGIRSARRQRGGALSLLVALLAIGAILYFALRANDPKSHSGGSDTGNALSCESRVTKLVQQTGGIGPEAKAQWDQWPPECRQFMPDPAALAPSPTRSQEN